jgi:hypothetical protein
MGIKKKKKKCRKLLYRYLKLKRSILKDEVKTLGEIIPKQYWNKQF